MTNNPCILIVDDNPANALLLSKILSKEFKITIIKEGQQAIFAAREDSPDLVILDVDMPYVNGFEICEQLKADDHLQNIPVIFVSAIDDTANKVKGFEVGGVDYITRPYSAKEVVARVKTHLSIRALQLQLNQQNTQLQEEINHRQQISRLLLASEAKYRYLFEKTNDAVFIIGLDFRHLEVNQQAADLLGYSIAEIVHRPATDFIVEGEHPIAMQQVERLLSESTLPPYERQFQHKSGRVFPAEIKVSLIHDDHGEPLYFHSVVRDITERKALQDALKKSEQQHREILDTVSEAVFATNTQGLFTYVNPVMVKRSNFSQDELIGKHFIELIDEGWQNTVLEFYVLQLEQRQRETVFDFPLKPFKGEQIWVEQTVNLIIDEDKVTGFLGIARDITEKKQIEAEKEQLIAELDAFAHTVAHDLKSPISTLRLYSQILNSKFDQMSPEKRRDALHTIQSNTDKMTDIIEALLLLGIVRKKDDIAFQHLEMSEIIDEARDRLKNQSQQARVEYIIPKSLPVAVGYAPWIEEIWVNYFSNAMKYGGEPPVIEVGSDNPNNGFIRFWVKDNGKGISAEEQDRVFIPFTRLNQSEIEGHGLGLSIVQRITEKLGGWVGVDSEVGIGSTFYFTLPSA